MILACPQCGYDLRGLPAGRCPECGFGYDHEGVRALESAARLRREENTQEIFSHAALIAGVLIFTGRAFPAALFIFPVVKAGLLAYGVYRMGWYDPAEPPRRWLLLPLYASFAAICLTVSVLMMLAPPIAWILGAIVTMQMWRVFLGQPRRATYEVESSPAVMSPYRLHSPLAYVYLFGATAWAVLAWMPGTCL